MNPSNLDITKIGLCKEIVNHWVLGFKIVTQGDGKLLLTLAIAMESAASDLRREVAIGKVSEHG
jgi:hypothetical protein